MINSTHHAQHLARSAASATHNPLTPCDLIELCNMVGAQHVSYLRPAIHVSLPLLLRTSKTPTSNAAPSPSQLFTHRHLYSHITPVNPLLQTYKPSMSPAINIIPRQFLSSEFQQPVYQAGP
jgi:hypothetical protein